MIIRTFAPERRVEKAKGTKVPYFIGINLYGERNGTKVF